MTPHQTHDAAKTDSREEQTSCSIDSSYRTPQIDTTQPSGNSTSNSLGLFGRLPLEVREQIYLAVMATPGNESFVTDLRAKQLLPVGRFQSFDEVTSSKHEYFYGPAQWAPPPLARASRSLRLEILAWFWRKHDFLVHIGRSSYYLAATFSYFHRCHPGVVLGNLRLAVDIPEIPWTRGLQTSVGFVKAFMRWAEHLPNQELRFVNGLNDESRGILRSRRWEKYSDLIAFGKELELQGVSHYDKVEWDLVFVWS
jgi:hypothetical protein